MMVWRWRPSGRRSPRRWARCGGGLRRRRSPSSSGRARQDHGRAVEIETAIPYEEIPHFRSARWTRTPAASLGRLDGRPVVAMHGRFHRTRGTRPANRADPRDEAARRGDADPLRRVRRDEPALGGRSRPDRRPHQLWAQPVDRAEPDELGPRFPTCPSRTTVASGPRRGGRARAAHHAASGVYVRCPART